MRGYRLLGFGQRNTKEDGISFMVLLMNAKLCAMFIVDLLEQRDADRVEDFLVRDAFLVPPNSHDVVQGIVAVVRQGELLGRVAQQVGDVRGDPARRAGSPALRGWSSVPGGADRGATLASPRLGWERDTFAGGGVLDASPALPALLALVLAVGEFGDFAQFSPSSMDVAKVLIIIRLPRAPLSWSGERWEGRRGGDGAGGWDLRAFEYVSI